MICLHCFKAELILVHQDLPYSEEHYICPICDSTFPTEFVDENKS